MTQTTDPWDIAIIGMACRFPGASHPRAFWDNLVRGVESITFFSDEELRAAGEDPTLQSHPHYVKAAPMLEGHDAFDAAFFGYSPREARHLARWVVTTVALCKRRGRSSAKLC